MKQENDILWITIIVFGISIGFLTFINISRQTEIRNLKKEAIDKGFAEWKVVAQDNNNPYIEFTWKSINSNQIIDN